QWRSLLPPAPTPLEIPLLPLLPLPLLLFPPPPLILSQRAESRPLNGTQQQPTRRWLLCTGMQRSSTSGSSPKRTNPQLRERKTSSSCSKRNWKAAKTMPSPGKEPTPPKRSAPLPATTRRQEGIPTNSSKPPRREAKKKAAAAAGEAA